MSTPAWIAVGVGAYAAIVLVLVTALTRWKR